MIARRYAVLLTGQLVQGGLALVTLAALTRLLDPADFGITVLVTAAVTIGSVAVGAGMQAATLVTTASSVEARPGTHGAALAFSAAVLAIVVVIGLVVCTIPGGTGYLDLGTAVIVVSASRMAFATYAGLVAAALSGVGAAGWASLVAVTSSATALIAPLGSLALPANPLSGALVGAFVGNVVWAGVAFVAGTHVLGLSLPRPRTLWRRLVRTGIPLHVGTLAYWLMLRADAFAVGLFLPGASVGAYGLALSLSERIGMLATPVYTASASFISGPDRATSVRHTLLAIRVELTIMLIAVTGTLLAGPAIITWLAGPGYQEAVLPLAILVPGAALLPIWPTLGLLLVAHADAAWLTARIQVTVAVAAVFAHVAAVPAFGVAGAALVSTASNVLLVVLGIAWTRRFAGFRLADLAPRWRDLFELAAAGRRALGSRVSKAASATPDPDRPDSLS